MGYRNYSVANGFTVDPSGNGDFTTISSALTAATSGTTIFIRPGTYTENPALKAGVNLTAFTDDGLTPTVTINGTCSFSSAGTVSISGIQLQTNSTNLLSVSGSAASIVNLDYCYLNCLNNTGISLTSSGASSRIEVKNCDGNLATTGIGLYSCSGSGTLLIRQSTCNNTGNSVTASSCSSGTVNLTYAVLSIPISYTSTGGGTITSCQLSTNPINVIALTINATSTTIFCEYTSINSGSAAAISIGASATATLHDMSIFSTATNVITGSGTLNIGSISYVGTGFGINTSTVTSIAQNVNATWLPVLTFGGSSTGITFSTQSGIYWQIGALVFFNIRLTLTSQGSQTGIAAISLPSTSANDNAIQVGAFELSFPTTAFPTGTSTLVYEIMPNTSIVSLFGLATTGKTQLTNSNFSNNALCRVSGFYWTIT